jgi:hypothetical protein
MQTVTLTQGELDILDRQDPATESEGGFQSLLVELQNGVNRRNGQLNLSDEQEERIPRYAFDYQNGGWQNRLQSIFSRTLGNNLGR